MTNSRLSYADRWPMLVRTMRSSAVIIFGVLGLVWGSNFLTTKWAAVTLTAGQISLLRVVFGFLPVLAWAVARGHLDRSHLRHAHHFVVMSVLGTSFHYFAYASGASALPSGVAGALSGSIPLFAVLGAAAALRGERITGAKLVGVLVGFAGVLLVARPWAAGTGIDTGGVLFLLAGSAGVGLSFVYAKRYLVDLGISPAALTTYQMGLGLLTLGAITDLDGITAVGGDAQALLGLVIGLGLLGTGISYILYYVLVDRLGAVVASSSTYLPPVVALAIGALVAGEQIAWLDGAGVALILAGVAFTAVAPAMVMAPAAILRPWTSATFSAGLWRPAAWIRSRGSSATAAAVPIPAGSDPT